MTLIETFRNETSASAEGGSPLSEPSTPSVNVLYFPTGLGFGKFQALPYAEEVEYPERDLADLLVRARVSPHKNLSGIRLSCRSKLTLTNSTFFYRSSTSCPSYSVIVG